MDCLAREGKRGSGRETDGDSESVRRVTGNRYDNSPEQVNSLVHVCFSLPPIVISY
jgi:hypothetical protein